MKFGNGGLTSGTAIFSKRRCHYTGADQRRAQEFGIDGPWLEAVRERLIPARCPLITNNTQSCPLSLNPAGTPEAVPAIADFGLKNLCGDIIFIEDTIGYYTNAA